MRWRRALLALLVIVALAVGGMLVWAATPLGPSDAARAALRDSDAVAVTETSDAWVFVPTGSSARRGFVFYPGGRVDLRSYAPFAHDVARTGTAVVVLKAPLSLAILNGDAAKAAFSQPGVAGVRHWVVGGHSLGGVTAASFAAANPDRIDGLLLLASYPLDSTDLSGSELEVTDVTGERDGVLNQDNWRAAKTRLPSDTVFVQIPGGNHAQFGDYGPQPGDNEPQISAQDQRKAVVQALGDLFDRIEGSR